MSSGGEFVDGWLVAQVLGEGAYGEVRLLVHSRSGACVALKAVRGEGGTAGGGDEGGEAAAAGAREAAIHRALRHPNVLRCLGERHHRSVHYLFLEYAQGGELFDRIEPDVGMGEGAARRYWRQLLAGLRYLHARGVAHRDIKPENLLLDDAHTLKISDFGMATLFRHGRRERLLARVCGTVPYAAPEVLGAAQRPYRAAPADLWAAALVLLAMLAGELAWERASPAEVRYAAWSAWAERGGATPGAGPWRKLSAPALALLRRALRPDPARRPTLDALLAHRWLAAEDEHDAVGADADGARAGGRAWSSQPCGAGAGASGGGGARAAEGEAGAAPLSASDMDELLSYSQPAQSDDLLLETQGTQSTQGAGGAGGVLQRLVRRMTRVFVRCAEQDAIAALAEVLTARGYLWRHVQPRILAIECGEVKMRAWAVRVCGAGGAGAGAGAGAGGAGGGAGCVMIEFRRSRGCGLAFKRRYMELREALRPLAAPPPAHADLLAPLAPLDCPMDVA